MDYVLTARLESEKYVKFAKKTQNDPRFPPMTVIACFGGFLNVWGMCLFFYDFVRYVTEAGGVFWEV